MAFDEHTKRKFQLGNPYADYEYVNKRSRLTWPGLLLAIVLGLGLCAGAWYRWQQITAAEETGNTISLSRMEWLLYNMGGKWVVVVVLLLLGALIIGAGMVNYRRLEKMKQ